MAVTKSYKVYGVDGHRQRESFNDSYKYDFSEGDEIRIIEVENSDRTGTNDTRKKFWRLEKLHIKRHLKPLICDLLLSWTRTAK